MTLRFHCLTNEKQLVAKETYYKKSALPGFADGVELKLDWCAQLKVMLNEPRG